MIDESIFKAYDIRGTYPEQLDEGVARDIGRAFVNHLGLSGSRVVVARDMRRTCSTSGWSRPTRCTSRLDIWRSRAGP
jgi:phosphomannomutase